MRQADNAHFHGSLRIGGNGRLQTNGKKGDGQEKNFFHDFLYSRTKLPCASGSHLSLRLSREGSGSLIPKKVARESTSPPIFFLWLFAASQVKTQQGIWKCNNHEETEWFATRGERISERTPPKKKREP